jgi:hydroxylamine reductase (hybrid-cluster protein)
MTLAKLRTVIYCYADGIPRLEAYGDCNSSDEE